MSDIKLKVVSATYFKDEPKDSTELEADQMVLVPAGEKYPVHSYNMALVNGHVKVALKDTFLGLHNRTTWYMYPPDIAILGNEPDNNPKDKPDPETPKISTPYSGRQISLPGYGSVFLAQPIIPGGNFSWGEATKNGSRIPTDSSVVKNIIKAAGAMQEIRSQCGGRAITVNSWYRDPATNRRVGGASRSTHIQGHAVDFVVSGIPSFKVNQMLEKWWGSRGGLASASSFTHIDCRNYRARWSY